MNIPELVRKAASIVADIRTEIQRQHALVSQEPLTEQELASRAQSVAELMLIEAICGAKRFHPMLEDMEANIVKAMQGFTAKS